MTGSSSEPIPGTVTAILTAAASGERPGVSPGGRKELVELLTRLVINPAFRDAYCRAVTAERVRLGVHRPLIAAGDSGDIPDLEIARNGFAGLTDHQLTDYAISPSAINAIADRLGGDDLLEDLGHWYIAAGMREVTVEPRDAERDRQFLLAEGGGLRQPDDPAEPTSPTAEHVTPSPPTSRSARWTKFAIPIAIAASLVVAFFLGRQWPAKNSDRDVRLASVTVRGEVVRGIEDVAIDVTNGSDRRAFLTFVGLVPGRKTPAYHYRQEGRYVEVPPQGTMAVANLPPEFEGTTVLLVFSTPVPAGGVIREVTPAGASPESAERDAERMKKALADLGIDSDVKVVTIPIAKR